MSGSESRVFTMKPFITESIPNEDEENRIDHPLLQVRKPEIKNNSASQKLSFKPFSQSSPNLKTKVVAPKNMIRTDSKQQKLDMFINISKSQTDKKIIDTKVDGSCKFSIIKKSDVNIHLLG